MGTTFKLLYPICIKCNGVDGTGNFAYEAGDRSE